MCPVMIINNALWLIIRGLLWKAIGNSPAPLLFKRSLFNQLAPDLLGTLVSLSAPTQWVDPYGKKGWVFQTPFRYGLTPSVSQVKAYLDYRGMSASRAMSATVYLSIFHIDQAAIIFFRCFYSPLVDCGLTGRSQLKPPRSPTNFLLSATR